jgi:signal transduction histidine kinase
VQELEAKYQVQEGKLQNAELTADNERQKVTIISIAGSALTLLLIGVFIYKNQDKKRRIAKQEMELEKQRADNLMKNQELATIDAMIAGQEKERKKLAEDLHDDLGSSLTTIRLYFDNLKDHFKPGTSSEIYNRTDKLLEDTYATIRGMSHSRHNGVLASKGLIPSLQTLAENITNSGKIKVNIFHHGMDRKLENSLELNIFRMLQELLSNVVKHAGATEASINIVGSKNTIDLMVEDNGKGFVPDSSKKATGMGLYSIETRVEEMDGTFDIDSNSGHGTTITIEIPTL